MGELRRAIVSTANYVQAALEAGLDLRLLAPLGAEELSSSWPEGAAVDYELLSALASGAVRSEDLVVSSAPRLEREVLGRALRAVGEGRPDFDLLRAHPGFAEVLRRHVARMSYPAPVAQHLLVMCARYPGQLERAVGGAWLAALFAELLDLDKEAAEVCFQASLWRDLGMLYVRSDVLDGVEIEPSERLELRRHVRLGAQIAVASGARHGPAIAEAISAHHERLDGTGYPRTARGNEIPLTARVVALADVIAALCFGGRHGLDEACRVLLFEQDGFDPGVFGALRRKVGVPAADDSREMRRSRVQAILLRTELLVGRVDALGFRLDLIRKKAKQPTELIRRLQKTLRVLHRSGHGDPELAWWLKQVASGHEEARVSDIDEIEAQQQEVLRRIERLEDELGLDGWVLFDDTPPGFLRWELPGPASTLGERVPAS